MDAGVSGLVREDADSEGGRNYAMLLADTVVCKEAGAPPDVATTLAHRDWKEVAYFLKVDEGGKVVMVVGGGAGRRQLPGLLRTYYPWLPCIKSYS
jgi:hypothetical protein